MKKALIINAHQPYPNVNGRLNASLAERIKSHLERKGYETRTTVVNDGYQAPEEVEKFLWANVVIVQSPVYWMSVPWIFKKYIDEVFSAGMGRLGDGDGRTSKDPKRNYGTGGKLVNTRFMLSLTYNAPAEAFNNPAEPFMEGKGVDDMFLPLTLAFRFLGMKPLPTFSCHDVMKAPEVEKDFERLEAHLNANFPSA